MAEDRSCLTCSHYLIDGCGDTKGCASLTGWQPIQKAPSFQITEEEARKILEVATILRVRGDMEIWIGNLKHAGYIRKSELVEFVKEAEKILNNDSDYYTPHDIGIVAKGFKALKKDHQEFGGKK